MNSNDFWNSLIEGAYSGDETLDFAGSYLTASEKEERENLQLVQAAVDARLSGRAMNEGAFTSVRVLTDAGREAASLPFPVEAGTRVQFANNLGAVMTYDDPPAANASGVVVEAKTASGMSTVHGDRVFVRWEDGVVRLVAAQHLRKSAGRVRTTTAKTASCIRVASLGDLTGFLRLAGTDNTLVHKATRDLWSVRQDGGDYVIERLFNESGDPLKV